MRATRRACRCGRPARRPAARSAASSTRTATPPPPGSTPRTAAGPNRRRRRRPTRRRTGRPAPPRSSPDDGREVVGEPGEGGGLDVDVLRRWWRRRRDRRTRRSPRPAPASRPGRPPCRGAASGGGGVVPTAPRRRRAPASLARSGLPRDRPAEQAAVADDPEAGLLGHSGRSPAPAPVAARVGGPTGRGSGRGRSGRAACPSPCDGDAEVLGDHAEREQDGAGGQEHDDHDGRPALDRRSAPVIRRHEQTAASDQPASGEQDPEQRSPPAAGGCRR